MRKLMLIKHLIIALQNLTPTIFVSIFILSPKKLAKFISISLETCLEGSKAARDVGDNLHPAWPCLQLYLFLKYIQLRINGRIFSAFAQINKSSAKVKMRDRRTCFQNDE